MQIFPLISAWLNCFLLNRIFFSVCFLFLIRRLLHSYWQRVLVYQWRRSLFYGTQNCIERSISTMIEIVCPVIKHHRPFPTQILEVNLLKNLFNNFNSHISIKYPVTLCQLISFNCSCKSIVYRCLYFLLRTVQKLNFRSFLS